MRVGAVVGSLAVAAAIVLMSPAAASFAATHDDPVNLHGADVVDQAGVLGSQTADVQAALDKLAAETDTQLFVVYVDTFTNPSDAQTWADESAAQSGLGDNDALLAIAVDDRVYRWSVPSDFPLSDGQIDAVSSKLEDQLADDDWAGGAIVAAQEIQAQQAPSPVLPILGGIAVVGVGGVVIGRAVAKRREKSKAASAAEADQKALSTKAGVLLVQLDDALKTSEQELGFAQAQFGEKSTQDFATALASAKDDAKQAFALQQKLDDAFPETPEDRTTMTEQLIALAEKADATLDAQADAFDQLRELEKNAPEVLETVAATQAGLADRIATAKTKVDGFAARFVGADLSAIDDAPDQARKLDIFAASAIENARAAIASGPAGDTAVAVRAAQQAVGQVEQLLTAVDARESELTAQQERNAQAARELDHDLADARAQIAAANDFITTHRGGIGSTARTRIAEAQTRLDDAVKLAATDGAAALVQAQSAEQLASSALSYAQQNVADFQSSSSGYGSESGGQSGSSYDGSDGAGLGGILGELFGGGGGYSGGSSGGGWFGGGGGGGSSHSSGSGWHPSSFGGSSRRSSVGRSSGSSRSSGGRRGGGGRF
ncbi:hypothetical protein BH11ACT3_BH11ACT3_03550 [soil metagenome]